MPSKPSGRSSSQSRTAFQHLQDQLRLVDLVVEVLDARAPIASKHPRSKEIFGNKPRLLIVTKEDLGDPAQIKTFLGETNSVDGAAQTRAISLSLKSARGKDKILDIVLELTKEKREQHAKKGLLPRPVRVCVVGMPNVGKSSLINWLVGQKRAKVGNRPGITKGAQWVRVHPQIELLDTPGILPAFAFGKEKGMRLALFNLLPEAHYEIEEVAECGLELMRVAYPKMLQEYISEPSDDVNLEEIARQRNFLTTGGKLDLVRAANIFVSDLRSGKLGRVTLDQPH